jgi:hypothetical protein
MVEADVLPAVFAGIMGQQKRNFSILRRLQSRDDTQ